MDQHYVTGKYPVPSCLMRRVQLGQSAARSYRVSTVDQTCARQERDWLRERGVMFRGCEHSWLKANRIWK